MTPVLIVVCGHPASGKTTLAAHLGRELGLAVIAKDDIKERLFDSLGTGDLEWSHRLGSAAFTVLFDQVDRHLQLGVSVIAEGNFRTDWAGSDFDEILGRTGARVITVVLDADVEILHARYRERAESGDRHPGHHDWVENPDAWEPYQAPALPGPRVCVDVTDLEQLDMTAVVDEVREVIGAPGDN